MRQTMTLHISTLANPPNFPGRLPFFTALSQFPSGVKILPHFSRFMAIIHTFFSLFISSAFFWYCTACISPTVSTWMAIELHLMSSSCHLFLDRGTKRIDCRYRLTGEVLILLGTGLFRSKKHMKGELNIFEDSNNFLIDLLD